MGKFGRVAGKVAAPPGFTGLGWLGIGPNPPRVAQLSRPNSFKYKKLFSFKPYYTAFF